MVEGSDERDVVVEPVSVQRDVAADAAAALEQAEAGDDAARLSALEDVHAALERELERPGNEPTRS